MILNIVALLLVLAITFLHSIWGLFSGLINMFSAIVAAVVAFAFFEPLTAFISDSMGLHTAYVGPACLVGLFVAALGALRGIADNTVRGNVHVPAAVDWIGGTVCGFVQAQIAVGILVLGVLMLPLGGTVMGFTRVERSDSGERNREHTELVRFNRNSLWLRSDEFTVGLFNVLSSGSLRGREQFSEVYPDFIESVFYSTNVVQPQSSPAVQRSDKRGDGFEGLTVESWWEQNQPLEARYRPEPPTPDNRQPNYKPLTFKAASGMKLIGVRLELKDAAADWTKTSGLHLFRPTMIRMVGEVNGRTTQYFPRVITGADNRLEPDVPRVVDLDNNFSVPARGGVVIDTYFEVDDRFAPEFVEYRRHARAGLTGGPAKDAPTGQLAGQQEEEQEQEVSFGRVLAGRSGDNNNLPFDMSRSALRGAGEFDGDRFAKGRASGFRSRFAATGGETVIQEFAIPEGYRLCQIRYEPREARSLVGDVFNFVGQLAQYKVMDDTAMEYPLSGYYAVITRNGEEYFEMYYSNDPDDPTNRHMLDFKTIERAELEADGSVISLMFLVRPGVRIVRIEDQAGNGGDIQLNMRP